MSKDVPRLTPRHGVAGAKVDLDVRVNRRLGRSYVETVSVDVLDLSLLGVLLSLAEPMPIETGQRLEFRRGSSSGVAAVRHVRTDDSGVMFVGVAFVSLCGSMERIVHNAIDTVRGVDAAGHWKLNR